METIGHIISGIFWTIFWIGLIGGLIWGFIKVDRWGKAYHRARYEEQVEEEMRLALADEDLRHRIAEKIIREQRGE